MTDIENSFCLPHREEFQPVIGYREIKKSPPLVVRQTHTLLGLFYQGAIRNPEPARDYFKDYTIGYLKAAEDGSYVLFDKTGQLIAQEVDLETREAASHAFVILAHLPDRATSPFLPNGFSRRGMLVAPTTQEQFLARIKELKIGLWQISDGNINPYATLEADPHILRVFKFFEVGNGLLVKLTADEREQEQLKREEFNDLLGGINTSL